MRISLSREVIAQQAALAAVSAAVGKGLELGCAVNAAVVDPGGNLMAFLRAEDAFLHSIAIAQDKAYTAAGFNMATHELFALIQDDPALREGLTRRDRLVAFPGGFPIRRDGRLIGGIGVSGGSAEQDCLCAQAGLAALEI